MRVSVSSSGVVVSCLGGDGGRTPPPIQARRLNSFKNSFKGTMYVFSYILYDKIICS